MQWQMLVCLGNPVNRNRVVPHKQPPFIVVVIAFKVALQRPIILLSAAGLFPSQCRHDTQLGNI
jgi:hypothetical protein